MSHLPSPTATAVFNGAERDEETRQQRVAHLDLVFCSSEDDNCPAHNLQTHCTAPYQSASPFSDRDYSLPVLHGGGWESEKFCEYPQELVFRVNRGIPTCIDSLHILSHHLKIASRVEVFTSSSTPRKYERNGEGEAMMGTVDFQRLGFVSFQSSETTDFSSRELKIVHLQTHEKITLIRLVLHRCHANRDNLFQQVGLLSVVASSSHKKYKSLHSSASWSPEKSGFLPSLHPSVAAAEEQQSLGVSEESTDHLFLFSLSPLRAKYATSLMAPNRNSPPKKVASVPTSLLQSNHGTPMGSGGATMEYEVWIPDLHELRTPLQIATRVRLSRELASSESGNGSRAAQFWRSMDLECRHLLNKLDILQRTYDDTSHLITVDGRVAMHEEIDHVVRDFGAIGSKALASELEILEQERENLPYTLTTEPEISLLQVFPGLKRGLETESWQTREELVWKVVEHLRKVSADDRAKPWSSSSSTTTEDEALAIAKQVLRDDTHSQVFIAGCSLLQQVLTSVNALQEPASMKNHLAEVLDVLLLRLNDHQAVVRNNAAFSILKVRYFVYTTNFKTLPLTTLTHYTTEQIAEISRAMGTFVMHSILKKFEGSKRQQQQQQQSQQFLVITDQVLHAVLKLFTALLLSLHCCASIDIAPRRILRFLLKSDADMHANPHIRDAAKQLTLAMYDEVGADVMEGYVSKLPADVQEMYQLQLKLNDEKKNSTSNEIGS